MFPQPQAGSTPNPPARAGAPGRWIGWTYVLYPALLLPIMLALSLDYGNTWDEKIHQIEGQIVWDWWRGVPLPDPMPDKNSYLYGALFDVICVAVQQLVPADPWVVRHGVNAVFGWLGILYAGRLAARLFGKGTGLLAMLLLTLAPRYFGEAANNPRDVPFAALSIMALFHLAAAEPRAPYLSWRPLAAFGAVAALALNTRSGALLLLVYLAVVLAVAAVRARDVSARSWGRLAGGFALVTLAVLLLGTLFWPWAFERPLWGPILGLQRFSNFRWNGFTLFDGQLVRARHLPWDYVPTWLAIATPPVLLAGAALSWLRLRRSEGRWALLGLWGVVAFPVAFVILRHSTLYNGVRHLLFVIPPLAILAAAGWSGLLARGGWARLAGGLVLAVGLAEPAAFVVRNHPNQIVYFNALAGGPRGAFGRYDLDYWGNCLLQETRWADALARASGVRLVVSGQPPHVVQIDSSRFDSLEYALPEDARHHLQLEPVAGPLDEAKRSASGTDVLNWTRTSDGTVICLTRKGPRFDELAGRLRPPR